MRTVGRTTPAPKAQETKQTAQAETKAEAVEKTATAPKKRAKKYDD